MATVKLNQQYPKRQIESIKALKSGWHLKFDRGFLYLNEILKINFYLHHFISVSMLLIPNYFSSSMVTLPFEFITEKAENAPGAGREEVKTSSFRTRE